MSWERLNDKLSSIFEISEIDCSKPVMIPIFSNSSHEMPNLVVLVYQISPLETLRLEIPVRGTLRKIQRDMNTPLPSNTIRTEIKIYVASHLISTRENYIWSQGDRPDDLKMFLPAPTFSKVS